MIMQSSSIHVSTNTNPIVEKAFDCIAGNTKEIMKYATILIRLIKIMRADRTPSVYYNKIAKKTGKKLQKDLELWNLYNRDNKEEMLTYFDELESVLKDREILIVRKKIGDICEKEYEVKLSAVNWDAENLNNKIVHLEKIMSELNCLGGQIESEDADEIRWHVHDDFKTMRELDLDNDVSDMLIDNIKTIAQIIF